MASAVPSQGWLENDENVVMRVNLCCEGGPCRWTHQPGERPPLALQGRVSQEMWTEFLTECKRDLAKYDKHKLAWISVPLIWLALLHVIPQAAHDIAVPIISIFCIVLMLVTFCLIKSRVEAAFGDIYRRWSPRFRERGLVMWHQTKIVETKGRRGKNTKTIQWYDIRPNPYEVTPAPEPYEIRPNPETVTAARQMQHLYGYGDEVSAAVQMQQVPAGAAVQMKQIQVAVPTGGASQPLVESATCISVDEVFPSLPAMVDIFERDLGIDGKLNVKEAVDRACAELGVDATQGDLIQKAQRCWELLGRPPGGAGAATRTFSGAQQSAVEGLDGQAVTDDPCGDGDVLEIAPRVARALEPFHLARGSTLRWAFRVEAYDLGFSLRRRGFMGGGVETDLVEAQRFGAVATFTGEWRADAACQVLAEFDNSYSVLRSKVVRYRFRVEKPPERVAALAELRHHLRALELELAALAEAAAQLRGEVPLELQDLRVLRLHRRFFAPAPAALQQNRTDDDDGGRGAALRALTFERFTRTATPVQEEGFCDSGHSPAAPWSES